MKNYYRILLIQLCFLVVSSFQFPFVNQKLIEINSQKHAALKNSCSNFISSSVRSIVIAGVCLTSTAVIGFNTGNLAAVLAEDQVYDPVVQGILDISDGIKMKTSDGNNLGGRNFLIQVYDSSSPIESLHPQLLAGAKLPIDDKITFPFRFQLFKENLMISEDKWNNMGDFEQIVVVSICQGPVEKGGMCKGKIIGKGEGISKVVSIGSESTEVRGVRLFSIVKIKPLAT